MRCLRQIHVELRGVESGTRDIATWMADRGVESAVVGDMGFLPRIWFVSLIVEEDP